MDIELSTNYIIGVFFIKFLLSIVGLWVSPPYFRKMAAVPFLVGAMSALTVVAFYINFEAMQPYGQFLLRFALFMNELAHILIMLVAFSALGINIKQEIINRTRRWWAKIQSWKPPLR